MDHLFLYQGREPAVIPLIPLGLCQSTTNLTDRKSASEYIPFYLTCCQMIEMSVSCQLKLISLEIQDPEGMAGYS